MVWSFTVPPGAEYQRARPVVSLRWTGLSASLNLADVLGIALGVGVGGAAVAAVSRGTRPIAGGVVIAFAVAALAASRPW